MVRNGSFSFFGDLITDVKIPEGQLFRKKFNSWKEKSSNALFCTVAGKNSGCKDDTAGVILGGKGSILMDSKKKIWGGEKYLFRAKAKCSGKSKPSLHIYWRSPKMKGPFDIALGIIKLPFDKKAENGYHMAEKVITVPERANAFTLLLNSAGGNNLKDKVFFDDVEVLKLP